MPPRRRAAIAWSSVPIRRWVTEVSQFRLRLGKDNAMTEHINKQFDQDLEAIRSRMMQMGGLVESQIRAAVAGYLDGDLARIETVIAGDSKVNDLEIAIDNDLGQIIVRRQPAASDLRLILAVSKTVTDLERIGDEAKKIARMSREIVAHPRATGLGLPT